MYGRENKIVLPSGFYGLHTPRTLRKYSTTSYLNCYCVRQRKNMTNTETTNSSENRKSQSKMVVALRFIFSAIPGLCLFLIFVFAFFIEIEKKGSANIHPLFSGSIVILGILMMLYGAGLWKQWRYVWVFVSIPLSILLYDFLNIEIIDEKLDIGLVALLAASFTNGVVRQLYKKA